jgi:hypothetical protein
MDDHEWNGMEIVLVKFCNTFKDAERLLPESVDEGIEGGGVAGIDNEE